MTGGGHSTRRRMPRRRGPAQDPWPDDYTSLYWSPTSAGLELDRALVGQPLGPLLVAAREQPVLPNRPRPAASQAPRLATHGAR